MSIGSILGDLGNGISSLTDSLFGASTSGSSSGTNTVNSSGTTTASGGTDTRSSTDSGNTITTNTGEIEQIMSGVQYGQSNTKSTTTSDSSTYNSGRTDTSQLLMSQEGVDHIVQTIFEGINGLADVSKGGKIAGLYDATTNQQLVNDLVSRTAGYIAEKTAKQVNTIGASSSSTSSTSSTNSTTNNVSSNYGTNRTTPTSTVQINGPRTINEVDTTGPRTVTNNTNATTNTQNNSSSHKDGLFDKLGWIICTELHKQGKIPRNHFILGASYFAVAYTERFKKGYYIWAEPSVKHLRNHPNSLYSRFLASWFAARAEYIAAKKGLKTARKTWYGFASLVLTTAFCEVLSRTIARNYKQTSVPIGLVKE